ncbi:sugar ABC transporter permease [Streptomyces sp. NPDC127092]|uniref:sugar ABC transporter permease n=1 Tax=Streptomyces sp. NPDC127092 TaxID=3347135 RepID=UPI00365F3E1C
MTAGDPGAGWAEEALGLLLGRVGETAEQVGDRFPLYADPVHGRWTTTGRGSWTGGFWAGLLRLRARHTGSRTDHARAIAATARLASWIEADTATRGLILWYGTALADEAEGAGAAMGATRERAAVAFAEGDCGGEETGGGGPEGRGATYGRVTETAVADGCGGKGDGADERRRGSHDEAAGAGGTVSLRLLRQRAADAVLAGFDPVLGLVPWGSALGGPRLRARADGVPGLVPLLATAGPEGRAAAAHLHRHLDLCLPPTAARRPVPAWHLDAAGGWTAEADPAPGWTRGEAWLLLAVADALTCAAAADDPAVWRVGRLTDAAELLLHSCAFLTGPLVPPADARRPEGPYDTSAAAIAAVALLKLAQVPGTAAAWASACAARAAAVLHRLASPVHLTRPAGSLPAGMLLDGCYDARGGTAVRHELVWGDYFLALGLAALLDRVDLRRV